ncbi:PAS domain S-box protein [Spirulina subsalsa]|uniref:PAS domain S-box protein n=1 Tax=Spirulina subsalsa TaxID=54311 RepID=UPI0002FB4445|nr:PAS domain S-box protein [Spirulina subsalsa]
MIEQLPVAIALLDCDYCYTVASRPWQEDYNLVGIHFKGQSFYDLFPQVPNHWRTRHQQALAGVTQEPILEEIILPRGNKEWVKWQVKPWRAEGEEANPPEAGEIVGLILTSEIVTTQQQQARRYQRKQERLKQVIKQHTAELEHRNQELNTVFEKAGVGLDYIDRDGRFLRVNQRFCDILGYSAQELSQLTVKDITHPEDWAKDAEQQAALLREQGDTYILEKRYLRADGSDVWVSLTKSVVRDSQGKPQYFIGAITDLRQHKELEQELALRQSQLDAFVNHAPVGLAIQDPQLYYVRLNPRFAQMNGVSVSDHLGKRLEQINPTLSEQLTPLLQQVVNTGQAILAREISQMSPDDSSEVWTQLVSVFPLNYEQKILGVGTILVDITEQKRVEGQYQQQAEDLAHALQDLRQTQAQLIQTEKMSSLGQLLAGVAHEINNPVNFIYGNLTYAQEYIEDLLKVINLYQTHGVNTVPEVEDYLEEVDLDFLLEDLRKVIDSMSLGTNRIKEIVASLRTFSRMDNRQRQLVDIHEGLESTLLILEHRLKAQPNAPEIRVIKQYQELPKIKCFLGQLNQVFMNILSNAIDALEEQAQSYSEDGLNCPLRTITITTSLSEESWGVAMDNLGTDPRMVEVCIADNGPGIPPTVQDHLFDPFFTTKPVGKGTGLGLAISHQIITEKHQGYIHCQSTLGEGTKFVITLPIVP